MPICLFLANNGISMNGLFLHTAKTGGKSTRNIIEKYNHLSTICWNNNQLYHHTDSISIFLYPCNFYQLNNSFKWCFVRNPFDRIVSVMSAWNYKGINKTFEDIVGLAELGVYLNWDLPNFPLTITHTEKFQRSDFAILDHLKPMHQSIHKIKQIYNISLDFIGRYENIDDDWKFIKQKINIQDTLPHLNKSTHDHYTKYYTSIKLIRRVIDIYELDFDFFNYSKELK